MTTLNDVASPAALPSMDDIVALARDFATARHALETTAEEIRELQRKAVRNRIRGLRSRIAEAAAAHDALRAGIESRPDLFVKPRTAAVDGVKFGFRKQGGAMDLGDEAQAIKLLRRKFADRAETLVIVKETLDKKALRRMTAAELARIGVTIDSPTDAVVIDVAESDVDKLIAALIEDAEAIEAEAA